MHNGRDATPKPLTVTDLVDIEETYAEEAKQKRTESLWDSLTEHVGQRRVPSVFQSPFDPNTYFKIPDMDEITAEVRHQVWGTFVWFQLQT